MLLYVDDWPEKCKPNFKEFHTRGDLMDFIPFSEFVEEKKKIIAGNFQASCVYLA